MNIKPFQTKISLGKVAYSHPDRKINQAEIEVEVKLGQRVAHTIDLQRIENYAVVSLTAGIWDARKFDYEICGQCLDTVAEFFKGNQRVERLVAIWERWHLNDMKSGTRAQNEAIAIWLGRGNQYDYTKACDYLKAKGLYEDNGYKYGHEWLVEIVPDEILVELEKLANG